METTTNNGKKVSESSVFAGFAKKAEGYLTTPGRVTKLLNDAYQKASKQKDVSEIASDVWDSLQDLFRLVKMAINGEYTGIPTKTVIGAVAVLIYFISPIDVVPDFIPIVGLLDDMSLMAWFMTSIKDELDKFRAWEGAGGKSARKLSSSLGAQEGKTGNSGASAIKDHGDQGGRALPGSGTAANQNLGNHGRSSSTVSGNAGQGSSYQSQSTKMDSSGEPGTKTGKDVNSPAEAKKIANSHGTSRDSEYLAAGRNDGEQKSPTAAGDFPGSAGEMRRDVKGEAKDETYKVGGSASGSATGKTTGNIHSDENSGNGKNLGDSSRVPKGGDNPNKDGAHNR